MARCTAWDGIISENMNPQRLELCILDTAARIGTDQWLPSSIAEFRNRIATIAAAAANTPREEIEQAIIFLATKGYLLVRKWKDSVGWQSFDFQNQHDETYVGAFFYQDEFQLKVTHEGRRHLADDASETPPKETEDHKFARFAIDEARKSTPEDIRPHPKVGAIVTKDGSILSKAHRGEKPKSHAEYTALEVKLPDSVVAGATVYTTLEPCTTRKHPKIPCAQRLIDRKVARVVIGMLDPNPDIRGRGDQLLSEAGIEVQLFPRDLRAQVEEMNREFIRAQKQRQTATKLNASIDRINSKGESHRPRIVAVRYGSLRGSSKAYYGLVVVNEGESAYDVSIPESAISIGSARLMFRSGISRLTKEQGEALIEAWIETGPHESRFGSDLFDQMRKANIPRLAVSITYKDGDNRWYKTLCEIARDVHAPGGLTARFIRQRPISRAPKPSPEAPRAGLPQKSPLSQARGGKELSDPGLKNQAVSLANEILRFLEDIGPKPKPSITSSMTEDEIVDADSDKIGSWVDRVHHTYFAKFRDRVDSVSHGLAAEGLSDPELNACIDLQVQTANGLRTIAEKLLLLSSRLPQG